jgi:hypothetical protein
MSQISSLYFLDQSLRIPDPFSITISTTVKAWRGVLLYSLALSSCDVLGIGAKMEPQTTIMVQVAEQPWTERAVNAACALAHECSAQITLLSMVRVQQVGLLGSVLGDRRFTRAEQLELLRYVEIIARQGLSYAVQRFQYVSLAGAIPEAAELVDASIVFATLPSRLVPMQRSLEMAAMRRTLARQGRMLIADPDVKIGLRFPRIDILPRANTISAGTPSNR